MDESITDRDGHAADAAEMGPIGPPTAQDEIASSAPGVRTPRWIWLWLIPVLALILLYLARRILGPFIIAGILAYIFSMVIDKVEERLRWPRWLIVTLFYVLVVGALGVGVYFGASALYQQSRDLVTRGPQIIENTLRTIMGGSTFQFGGQSLTAHDVAQRISDTITNYAGGGELIGLARTIGERILDALLVLVVCFYLLLDGKRVGSYLLKFVPAGTRTRTGYVAGRIHAVLGAYLRGQLYLILIMSVASFIVLQFIFQVPYALPLAILTGFLEILPLLGPAIAATIAAGVALSGPGAGAAIGVIIAYVVLRELEDQVVMPMIVGRVVELHPVVTIFAVLAGGAMAGVLGMVTAVPVAAAIKVILDFLYPTDTATAMAQAAPGIRRAEADVKAREQSGSR